MSDHLHVVFDESAIVAAGRGNVLASELIHQAHTDEVVHLYAPACALVEADRARPGSAEHIAALPSIIVLDLDLPAALAIARQATWGPAHTRYAAEPSAERPGGAVIATTRPELWAGEPVRVLDLTA